MWKKRLTGQDRDDYLKRVDRALETLSNDARAFARKLVELLDGQATYETVQARSVLWERGSPVDHCLLVLDGSLEEWGMTGRTRFIFANAVVGGAEAFRGRVGERLHTVTARERTELLKIPRQPLLDLCAADPQIASRFLGLLAASSEAQITYQEREEQAAHRTEWAGHRGMLIPGPYEGKDCLLHVFLVDYDAGQRDLFRSTMPPGVRPHPAYNFFLLVHSRMPDFHHKVANTQNYAYDELGVMVPVDVEGKLRFYIPYLFPDNLMAIFGGREVYGLQKMHMRSYTDPLLNRLITYEDGEFVVDIQYEPESVADADLGEMRELVRDLFDLRGLHDSLDSDDVDDEQGQFMNLGMVLSGLVDNSLTSIASRLLNPFDDGKRARKLKGVLVDKLLEKTNDWLASDFEDDRTCLPSLGWKRIYHHSAQMKTPDKVAWDPSHFQVDELISYPFSIQRVLEMDLIRPTHFAVADRLIGQKFPKVRPLGFRLRVDMDMGEGETLIDYRERFKREPPKLGTPDGEALAWGPGAWDPTRK